MSQTTDDKFKRFNMQNRKYARRLSINNRELLIAISENDYDKVEYLINGEIDINFKDTDGKTPLYWAIESNNEAIIKLLLRKQGNNIESTEIETLIDYVQSLNRPDILKILNTLKLKLKVKCENALAEQHQSNIKPHHVLQFPTLKQLESWQEHKTQMKRGNEINPIHGHIYQLNLLVLFLYRSVSLRYSFQLGTEISEANKFDDLVFKYIENGKTVYRLLQAKHKMDESKKIRARDLFEQHNGNYSLIKYFFSYQKCKNDELFKNGSIKDVTICTNIDWDYEDLKNANIGIEKITSKDDILDFKNMERQPVRYKFSDHVAVLLKSKIDNRASDLGKESVNYTDNEIKDFLNHLVFAVNQPNAEELGNIVENEIGKEFGLVTTENVYNKLFRKMLKWLMGKGKHRFLSHEEGKKFLEEAKSGIIVWFNVRDPTRTFVGRDKELSDLHNALQNRSENTSKLICVSGLGGVGKSELVRRYINRYSQEYDNKIIWINAESYQTLVDSFRRLASDKLGVATVNADNKEKKICSIVEDIYNVLSGSKCLFIFDNAVKYESENEFDHGIENFLPSLPRSSNKLYTLITSRINHWPSNVHVLELDVFHEYEAIEFVKKSLNIETDALGNISVLAKKLHYFPLALQQTVCYIKTQNEKLTCVGSEYKIDNYLKNFNEGAGYLEAQGPRIDYISTIVTTWNITFDTISQNENGSNAFKILAISSYLASEEISTKIFLNLINSEDEVASAIQLLNRYSVINLAHETFNMHKLVQEAIRRKLKSENKEEEILIEALTYFMNNGVNAENINHAISIWNHTMKHGTLVIKYLYFAHFIVKEFLTSVRYDEAYSFSLRYLDLLNTLPHNDTFILHNTLMIKNVIGLIYTHQGKYNTAIEMLRQVMNECIAKSHYFEFLIVADNLGLAFYYQGKYDEALKYFTSVLDIIKANDIPPILHNEITAQMLSIQSSMAGVFCEQGKYDIALEMLLKVNKRQKQILGGNHRDTLSSQCTIAAIFGQRGKYSEALKIYSEAYKNKSKTLNQYDPSLLLLKHNIAAILHKQGKLVDSFNMLQEVLNIQKQVLNSDHPDILMTRQSIAEILSEQSKYEEAMTICQDVLNKQKQILGVEHPDTLNTLKTKANILNLQGKYELALQIYTELLSKWKYIFTEDHPQVIFINGQMSEIYGKLCNTVKAGEALNSLQQNYEIQRKRFGDDHLDTLTAKNNVGLMFYRLKKLDVAEKIFEESYNKLKSIHPNHYQTHIAKNNLALISISRGKYEEALRMFWDVYDCHRSNLGEDHEATIATKYNISATLISQLKYIEASAILCDVIKKQKRILGLGHPATKDTIDCIRVMLKLAMNHNDVKVIKEFFEKCADVSVADLSPVLLCDAIESGKAHIVDVLLRNGADVALVNSEGKTSLHIATVKGDKQIVENLLRHVNRDELYNFVTAKTVKTGSTSLHIAAIFNNLKIVKILLEHGAEYNVKNNNNKTPFSLSKSPGIIDLFKSMKELFEEAENGNTSLIDKVKAIQSDQFRAVINARNHQGNTLLQVLKNNGHTNTSKMYLEALKYKNRRV